MAATGDGSRGVSVAAVAAAHEQLLGGGGAHICPSALRVGPKEASQLGGLFMTWRS